MRNDMNQFAGGQFSKDYYSYSFFVSSIAPATQGQAGFTVDASADFMAVGAMAFATNANASQTEATRLLPLVTISIRDGGSGRELQSQPVPIPCVAGSGELPFLFAKPRLFSANSAVVATFTNFDAAVTYSNLYYVFLGYQIFKFG